MLAILGCSRQTFIRLYFMPGWARTRQRERAKLMKPVLN